MNEKERIIELVKNNVITMDEALKLLEAGGANVESTETTAATDATAAHTQESVQSHSLENQRQQLKEDLKKLAKEATILNQRLRELEILQELEGLNEEMEAQEAELKANRLQVEAEQASKQHQLEQIERKLNLSSSSDQSNFRRFVDRQTDRVADVAQDVDPQAWVKEGKRVFSSLGDQVKDFIDNFQLKSFDVSVNVPWVKKEKLTHQFEYTVDELKDLDIELTNGSISVESHEGDQVLLDAEITFYGDHDEISVESFERLSQVVLADQTFVLKVTSPRLAMDGRLKLPADQYDHLNIKLSNGDVELHDLVIDEVILNNKNGDIDIKQLTAHQVTADLINSDSVILDSQIEQLQSHTINGDLRIVGQIGNVTADSVNGDFYLTKTDLGSSELKIDAVHGDVKLSISEALSFYGQCDTLVGKVKNRLSHMNLSDSDQKKGTVQRMVADSPAEVTLKSNLTTGDVYLKDCSQASADKEA